MGIISFFFGPADNTKGSCCDTRDRSHHDYLEGEKIDEEVIAAENRGDDIAFSASGFHDEAMNKRHDDYGRPVEYGPEERKDDYAYDDSDGYYYADMDYSQQPPR